jgi:hypothetical protein
MKVRACAVASVARFRNKVAGLDPLSHADQNSGQVEIVRLLSVRVSNYDVDTTGTIVQV